MNRHDRKLWAEARTLTDLGELTAQWLEGRIRSVPGVSGGPDEETRELIPVLAACNRAGFVTESSQPGVYESRWSQRAAVSGFADDATLRQLRSACAGQPEIRILVTRAPRFRASYKTAITVIRDGNRDFTDFGAALSRRHLSDPWTGYGECHPDAVRAVCDALQVTLIDMEWGCNDWLWPALAEFAGLVRSS